ncbi:MAG: nitrate reductase cytochrome c-type subunit [Candidatus Hydrogenedentes bacterium]|nr:nitrate reductase cytochrome c-type subunit [Candidatus Hydrogenedentota bacterium]
MNARTWTIVTALVLVALACGWHARPTDAALAAAPEQEEVAGAETEAQRAAEQAEADRDHRASLRAFYAAPPVIPHESESMQDSNCSFCHSAERELPGFERKSPRSPHPYLERCTQCHVASQSPLGEAEPMTITRWAGLQDPGEGHRAGLMAPPVMPHKLRMRENCISCHSPESPYVYLRTPHPERVNCQQCHVADEGLMLDRTPATR